MRLVRARGGGELEGGILRGQLGAASLQADLRQLDGLQGDLRQLDWGGRAAGHVMRHVRDEISGKCAANRVRCL